MPNKRQPRLPEALARCPFCAALYTQQSVRVVGKKHHGETTHASCGQCLRSMIFATDCRGGHVACVGVLTDCNAEEAIRFEKGQKISLDEVLKAHVELRK